MIYRVVHVKFSINMCYIKTVLSAFLFASLANSYSSFKTQLKYQFCKVLSKLIRYLDLVFPCVLRVMSHTPLSVFLAYF